MALAFMNDPASEQASCAAGSRMPGSCCACSAQVRYDNLVVRQGKVLTFAVATADAEALADPVPEPVPNIIFW